MSRCLERYDGTLQVVAVRIAQLGPRHMDTLQVLVCTPHALIAQFRAMIHEASLQVLDVMLKLWLGCGTQSKAHLATLLKEIGEEAQARALYDEVMDSMTERRLGASDGAILIQRAAVRADLGQFRVPSSVILGLARP